MSCVLVLGAILPELLPHRLSSPYRERCVQTSFMWDDAPSSSDPPARGDGASPLGIGMQVDQGAHVARASLATSRALSPVFSARFVHGPDPAAVGSLLPRSWTHGSPRSVVVAFPSFVRRRSPPLGYSVSPLRSLSRGVSSKFCGA